jgi:hypothetical protein
MGSMELFLNLIWLLLATASIALWCVCWHRALAHRGGRRLAIRSAVGLMCVLLLMFFAISMTDDLQQVPLLAEDSAKTWLKAGSGGAVANHRVTPPIIAAVPVAPVFLLPGFVTSSVAVDDDAFVPAAVSARSIRPRAPPLATL